MSGKVVHQLVSRRVFFSHKIFSYDGITLQDCFTCQLLTCGLVPYENFVDPDESESFKDINEIHVLMEAPREDSQGMVEVSLSNSNTDFGPGAKEVLEGENELFNLIPVKNSQK